MTPKMRKGSVHLLAVFAAFVSILLISVSGAVAAEGAAEGSEPDVEYRPEEIDMERMSGTTDEFGGGDYVAIRFSRDAAFGVVYGTEDNPNSIIIYSAQSRYLGVAETYDENGAKNGRNVPIRTRQLFVQKLEDMFEYNDTNGDGMCDYRRAGLSLRYGDYFLHEPVYKRVSLEAGWERSEIDVDSEPGKYMDVQFTLTATNLSYEAVGNSTSIREDVANSGLEKVEFTFYLHAEVVELENISVPRYKVTVQRKDGGKDGGFRHEVTNSKRIKNMTLSGRVGDYDIKYDHLIQGWDFDPSNKNPSILLEFHFIAGRAVPPGVADWISHEWGEDQGRDVRARLRYRDSSEDEVISEEDTDAGIADKEPRRLRFNRIDLADDWERVGRLRWVNNVDVDGKDTNMSCQVQGFLPVDRQGYEGGFFRGFAGLAGFSYPGGETIFHDPAYQSSVILEAEDGSDLEAEDGSDGFIGGFFDRPVRGLLVLGIVIAVAVVVAVSYTRAKNKKRNEISRSYRKPEDDLREEEDWEEFYRK